MSLTAAVSGFVVLLLSVSVSQGQDGWGVTYSSTEVCAVRGSTVDINCTYRYPDRSLTVQNKFWFIRRITDDYVDLMTESEYSGRVQYICDDNNKCTLRINNVSESDSAEYKFRFLTNDPIGKFSGSPGVSLSVTEPPNIQVDGSYSSHLRCVSSCSGPSYVWFKNGENIEANKDYIDPKDYGGAGMYSCAVKGCETFPSPPASVYGPKLPSVSVSPSAEIVEGSSVTLTCSSDANPAATYTWYKKENAHSISYRPQLVFNPVQSSHSGEYYCVAVNGLGINTSGFISVDVTYGPKLSSVSVSPSAEIVEGSSVTLTCSSDANPAASYTWYKNNQQVFHGPEGFYHFTSISSEDRGSYYCKAENQHGVAASSPVSVNVQYGPKLPSVSVSPSAEIVEGSSVTLTCSSDANPAATYTWYKEEKNVYAISYQPQLVFNSVQSSHSGEYYCTAVNRLGSSTSLLISVDVNYGPKLPSVSLSPSVEIVEGSSVTLTCSSDANPAANYTWYKEDGDSSKASGQIFTITDLRAEHSGNYSCEAQNERGTIKKTFHLTVAACPHWSGKGTLVAVLSVTVVLMAIILLSVFLWIRNSQRRRKNFSTLASTSPRTRQMISTPTSEQLSLADSSSLVLL